MRPPHKSAINPRALVSIGTNSTRLLVLAGDEVVAAESRGTRLGTGLTEGGRLDPQARERTLAAIAEYMAIVERAGATVACIATSAMRRASDGATFARDVETLTHAPLEIISGDQEATYSFLGATWSVATDEPVGVLDVGGGSTEIAIDRPPHAQRAHRVAQTLSLEIGAVRLSERHPALLGAAALSPADRASVANAARADAAAILAPLAGVPRVTRLFAVGGTAFTAASMVAGAPLRDGIRIGGADRVRLIDDLLARDLDARRALPYIRPQRADILPAGLIVADEACRYLGVDTFEVSERDLLAGYLQEHP